MKEKLRTFWIKFKNLWLISEIIYWYNSALNKYSFWKAKHHARTYGKRYNMKYYVIPVSPTKMKAVNRLWIDEVNKRTPKMHRININLLSRMAYYTYTPNLNTKQIQKALENREKANKKNRKKK